MHMTPRPSLVRTKEMKRSDPALDLDYFRKVVEIVNTSCSQQESFPVPLYWKTERQKLCLFLPQVVQGWEELELVSDNVCKHITKKVEENLGHVYSISLNSRKVNVSNFKSDIQPGLYLLPLKVKTQVNLVIQGCLHYHGFANIELKQEDKQEFLKMHIQ